MAKALSQDLRDRVVAAIDDGLSRRAAAARFGVSVSSAIRWHQLAREHGRAIARKPGGDRRSSKTDAHTEQIMALLEEKGDITLAELQSGLAERDISVGIGTLWRFFNRHGITRKNVWPTPSARVMLDDVLVCINVSGLRAPAPAKMDHARLGPHKDGGVEHHIFDQALATRGQPLRHLSFTSTDIVSGVGAVPAAVSGQAATAT